MSEQPASGPQGAAEGRRGGKKIMGMGPTGWALTLGLALLAGGYLLYRNRKSAASAQSVTTGPAGGGGGCPQGYAPDASGNCQPVVTDYSGQVSTLQTEIMDLQSSEAQEHEGKGGAGAPAASTAPAQDITWVSTGLFSLNVVALSHRTSPEAIVEATQKHGSYGGIFESYVNKGNFNAKIPVGAILWIPQFTPNPVAVYSGEGFNSPGLSPGEAGESSGTATPGGPVAGQPGGGPGDNDDKRKPPAKKPPAKKPPARKPPPRKAPPHHVTRRKAA